MIREADRADIYFGIMQAKDPKKQIAIEADLYNVTTKEIEKVWKEESEKRSRVNFESVKRGPGRPKGTKPKAVTKTTEKKDFKKDETMYEASKINEDDILRPPTESTWQQTSSADEKPSVAAGVPNEVIALCCREYEDLRFKICDKECEVIALKSKQEIIKGFIEAQGVDINDRDFVCGFTIPEHLAKQPPSGDKNI